MAMCWRSWPAPREPTRPLAPNSWRTLTSTTPTSQTISIQSPFLSFMSFSFLSLSSTLYLSHTFFLFFSFYRLSCFFFLLSVFCLDLSCPPILQSIVTLCITLYSSRGFFFFLLFSDCTAWNVYLHWVRFTAGSLYNFQTVAVVCSADLKMKQKSKNIWMWQLVFFFFFLCVPRCNVQGENRRVLGLELDRDHHALFVAFSSCVIRVPLSRCSDYTTCKKWVTSMKQLHISDHGAGRKQCVVNGWACVAFLNKKKFQYLGVLFMNGVSRRCRRCTGLLWWRAGLNLMVKFLIFSGWSTFQLSSMVMSFG